MKKVLLSLLLLLTLVPALSAQRHHHFDKEKRLEVHGYGQVYYDALLGPGKNSFGVNKSELMGTIRITDQWSAAVLFQLNKPAMLKELHMSYRFAPELSLRVGQMKTPFGLENQVAPFLNPLSLGGTMPTVYFAGVGMDPLYSGTSGRDIGLELSGDLWDRVLSYKLAVMNGQGMNKLDLGTSKMYGGALYLRPTPMLTLHVSYLGGELHAMAAGKGVEAGAPYIRHRVSGGVQLTTKPVSLTGEYMYGKDAEVSGQGAYLTAVAHMTKRCDFVASVDYLRTGMGPGSLLTSTLGVQHWLNKFSRWQLEYRLVAPQGDGHDPMGHHIRMQFQFGF